jgi:predicted deacylase
VGDLIRVDEILGTIIDPITNETSNILATISGRIISMAVNQFVMPGYGCYHIGIEASEEKIAELGITDNIEGEVE